MALEVLDAAAVRRWADTACAALASAAAEIDAINVYPVPDGDTGTNLHLTMRSAVEALDRGDRPAELGPTLDRLTRGALLGARGNSGVIVSQILRGLADSLGPARPADGRALARALRHAVDLAYKAVAEPVEGTILSVVRAAADAASAVEGFDGPDNSVPAGPRLVDIARAAAGGAVLALERTPTQLAVLARAGVVDAGGWGLCVVLDALVATLDGQEALAGGHVPAVHATSSVPASSVLASRAPAGPDSTEMSAAAPGQALQVARESGSSEFGSSQCEYEVQFLLDEADEATVEILRADLAALGDSLVVVDAGASSLEARFWNVHIHVNDVGAAIEAGVRAGRPHSITVTRFADDATVLTHSGPTQCGPQQPLGRGQVAPPWSGRALVALSPGAGLGGLFTGEGVQVVVGEADRDPSKSDVLAAIRRTAAAEVVVLPNHTSLTTVADAAAEQARAGGQDVAVVPTKSLVQGLAAIAVADPARRFADDVIALAEAAAATRWAEITVAEHEAMTSAGRCAAGAVLGLAEGDVVLIGAEQVQVTCDLLDRLLSAGGELVTLVIGTDVVDGFVDDISQHLRRAHQGVELMDYRGDQPNLPVFIGVE